MYVKTATIEMLVVRYWKQMSDDCQHTRTIGIGSMIAINSITTLSCKFDDRRLSDDIDFLLDIDSTKRQMEQSA